jgi:hypothetical protein
MPAKVPSATNTQTQQQLFYIKYCARLGFNCLLQVSPPFLVRSRYLRLKIWDPVLERVFYFVLCFAFRINAPLKRRPEGHFAERLQNFGSRAGTLLWGALTRVHLLCCCNSCLHPYPYTPVMVTMLMVFVSHVCLPSLWVYGPVPNVLHK